MFSKIIIANRGEIARRIIRTCKKLGVKTVAVYSDADANSQFVKEADEAVLIGGAESSKSYLRGDKIIEVALETGAEAIHPGYGFLSENAEFSQNCAKSNIVFIGPPAEAINAMALKGAAKSLMENAGVPVTPGFHGEAQDLETLLAQAIKIGFPVLIKAVAGGGGKGMRRVDEESEFAAALISAQREGQNSFGNPKVLIEKYIEVPRHIEIQVFADNFGNVVHLFERDCSLQRRHQKVVEEAPAPNLPEAMREAMGQSAVAAAKAINYRGAGTVEFVVDVKNGVENAKHYFMEMNTRLQVEHPITEEITAVDLVEWQLLVASGQKLPKTQNELKINGHAIEVRLYAEDPENEFLPMTGKIEHLEYPNFARIESAVINGDTISVYYDPMIAKIIVHAPNRDLAIEKMRLALLHTKFQGFATNLGFLRRAITNKSFADAHIDTGFIARHIDELLSPWPDAKIYENAQKRDPYSPWNEIDGWWSNLPPKPFLNLIHEEDDEDIHSGEITSPMPGKIIAIMVKNGDIVQKNQPLLIVEAMKMEHTIKATIDGTISEFSAKTNDQIVSNAHILKIQNTGS